MATERAESGVERGARGPVVLLASPGPTTNIVHRALTATFGVVPVILEEPVSRRALTARRIRRLGYIKVFGQTLFVLAVPRILKVRGRKRIESIIAQHGLDASPLRGPTIYVPSVNGQEARRALTDLRPAVVVVNGTRIISKETLDSVPVPFINMHAGITPRYRGVHGGYWALAEGRSDLVGTTVHLVDTGIDTGGILGQATFAISRQDSFVTYPYLHVAAGLPLLVRAVEEVVSDKPPRRQAPQETAGESRLRYHPTLWGYVAKRLTRSVR
jgi:Formyl transferase